MEQPSLRRTKSADCLLGSNEDRACEVIDSRSVVHAGSGVAVSPAISLAISPSTDENYKTESDGNQSSNKPGSESTKKPNCYECKHRGCADFSAHSSCNHPIFDLMPGGKFLPLLWMSKGLRSPFEKRMNVTYNQHGFDCGWFMWPVNFDPCWLETCDFFEAK